MSNGRVWREKIREEELTQCEREGFVVELTATTFVASGTNAKDVIVVSSFETASIGVASITLITGFIVVETFGARMIGIADAQVDVVEETEEIRLISAQGMVFDHGLR